MPASRVHLLAWRSTCSSSKFAPLKAATTRSNSSSHRPRSTRSSANGGDFDFALLEERSGLCVIQVSGKGVADVFKDEGGGHRWQAVSPTDKKGRVHTSTVTVAVLPEPTPTQVVLHECDLEFSFCRGSGNGGQHKAKTDSAVQLKHLPSGVMVRCESERSQSLNKDSARAALRARLWQVEQERLSGARADARRRQVGSGMRGDKRRTIRTQDDSVVDHETGRTWRFKDYIRGNW